MELPFVVTVDKKVVAAFASADEAVEFVKRMVLVRDASDKPLMWMHERSLTSGVTVGGKLAAVFASEKDAAQYMDKTGGASFPVQHADI